MNPSVATELGIMTALRTGDPVRDLALCAAVPLAVDRLRESLHTIASLIDAAKERVGDLLAGGRTYTTHTVELVEFGYDSATHVKSIDENDHRALLFKAVSLYIADHVDLQGQSGRYALSPTAPTDELEAVLRADPRLAQRQQSQIKHALESNRELTQLDVMPLPPIGSWIPLGDGDLAFQYVELESSSSATSRVKRSSRVRTIRKMFVFRSRALEAPQKIRTFVDRAFAYYTEMEKRKLDNDQKRYLYLRNTSVTASTGAEDDESDGDDGDDTSSSPYKRYALGEEKTFDTVFFDEKPMVLKLLDDFTNKTGKFAIEGFPNKLGLLLHGPPGTGKTSVIKAIAQYTKRHIVSISLAKIQTNQELLDAMTDLRFAVRGASLPVKLTFEDVVFVMEDVDCATSVVKNRAQDADKPDENPADEDEKNPMAMLAVLLGQDELLQGLVASSNRSDQLNLAGLLNVLDGVIDCPGRIVVMTTNHPEKLDPALIRPGRVNKKIYLAWMPPAQIQKMLEYYFDTKLSESLEARVLALPQTITPAEVEEICAEHDEVDGAVTALEARVDRTSD